MANVLEHGKGMGAAPTSRLWQSYHYGFGPYIDGVFSQSNFGIVIKMGFWLAPKPERWTSFAVMSSRSEDLHAIVDAIQLMRTQGLAFSSIGGSPLRSANNATDGFVSQNIYPKCAPRCASVTAARTRNGTSSAQRQEARCLS